MINQFFENAKLIADKFEIIPLMYGSLGLEYITDKNLNADDIDILIPEIFLNSRWNEFKSCLIDEGYTLSDEHEHTFEKSGIYYSYASAEELSSFARINSDDVETRYKNGIPFKVLSLEQYLKVYKTSVKDGYRINVRKKKDNEKILFIENFIKSGK
ncbi:MAG: hypothetical protein IKA10_04180 [Oscillospiraceae bacterium]|nr:hypothetical protein [Oscillospiraceae bacterium]